MAISYLNNIDLHLNEIQNVRLQNVPTDPSGVSGQIIYNSSTGNPKYYGKDGKWHIFADQTYAYDQAISAVDAIFVFSGGKRTTINNKYLPSYVDDVLEYKYKDQEEYDSDEDPKKPSVIPADDFFPTNKTEKKPESGKIYVSLYSNKTYRWGGSEYVEISESLALGYTSSTAFPGDEGLTIQNFYEGTSVGHTKYTFDKVKIGGVESAVNKISRYAEKDFDGNVISTTYLKLDSNEPQAVTGPVSFNSKVSFATGSGKGISIGSKTIEEIDGILNISGNPNGNTKVNGTFETTGNAKLASLSVTGISTLNGATTIDNTLEVTDKATFSGTNGILIGTSTDGVTLTYSYSKLQIHKGVNVDGEVAGKSLTISGDTYLKGNTTIGDASSDKLTVNATPIFNNGLTVDTGTATFNGDTTIGNASSDKLTVNAAPTFNNGLTVDTGIATFNPDSGIKIGDGTIKYISNRLNIGENVYIPGTLTVVKATTLSSTLHVGNTSTFDKFATFIEGIKIGSDDNQTIITRAADTEKSTKQLHITDNVYVDNDIAAGGKIYSEGNTGLIQAVYNYEDIQSDKTYTPTAIDDTFNAYTIKQIYDKVATIERNGATEIKIVGDTKNNVITDVSKSNNTITFTKGIKALTESSIKTLTVSYGSVKTQTGTTYNPAINTQTIIIPKDIKDLANNGEEESHGQRKFTRVYSQNFTPIANKVVSITHNLKTKNVHVILYYKSTESNSTDEQIFTDVLIKNDNTVDLEFANITGSGTYTAVVIG